MNTKAYTAVRSKYLRDLIRQTRWDATKGRKYIDDLIILEDCILRPPSDYYGLNGYGKLRARYRKEFEIICRELRPEELKNQLNRDKQKEKDHEEFMKKLEQEKQGIRNNWIEAGGKV